MYPKSSPRLHAVLSTFFVAAPLFALGGCAKVTEGPSGGSGGSGGGTGNVQTIPDLASLQINPGSATVTLSGDCNTTPTGDTMFTATGTRKDGTTFDATSMVTWSVDPNATATVLAGKLTLRGPGSYTITAKNGGIMATATASASFGGDCGDTSLKPGLDSGSPSGQVTIAYPLDGAIFPSNFGPVTIQVSKSGSQDVARLSWSGDGLDLRYYGRCETGPGNGCYVTLPVAFTKLLIGPSSSNNIQLTARLGQSSGGGVVDSNSIQLAWAGVALAGGLYYWTTIAPGAVPGYTPPDTTDPRGTGVMRYNFDGDASKPELVYTDQGFAPLFEGSPPAQAGSDAQSGQSWGEGRCIGCHAISFDGKLMGFSIGGSYPSNFALLNLEQKMLLELDPTASNAASGIDALKRYRKANLSTFTTFGPNLQMVTMYRGKLTLRTADMTLAVIRDDLFAGATTEQKTDPFWSPDGTKFAFSTYTLTDETQISKYNGDTKTGSQIWIADASPTDGPGTTAKVLVPREGGMSSFYPTISHDNSLLAFNKSACSGPPTPGGYGMGSCDGYDDISATLWVVNPNGGTPQKLVRANGGDSNSNSWPRWSPDNGFFRGRKLFWLAFSSRRPYGLQVNSTGTGAKPQLWFAAILSGDEFTTDPSNPPVWLPNQNLAQDNPTGNHVPQWVKFAVPID